MIYIQKSTPPKKFQEFKQKPQAHYDSMPADVKSALRQSLLEEQGYLCAYCMRRIHNNPQEVKIEHYEPRNSQNELEYSNLLAVCKGNSNGNQFGHQHCDTKKGDKNLHINPQNIDHIRCISYRSDGTIYANDNDEFNNDLNLTLNLNDEHGYLKSSRKVALDRLKDKIHSEYKDKTACRSFIEKSLQFYLSKDQNGKRQQYCGIIIDYLIKRLKKWS